MAILHIRSVDALPGYRLALAFDDGTSGIADLTGHLTGPFALLREPAAFNAAYIDGGTVCWPGDLDLAAEYLYALAHKLPVPRTLEEVRANELEVSLRELRRITGMTQAAISEATGLDQGQLSRFERNDDRRLSTLRKYVEALGGTLEVTAVLGDKRLTLRGV